MLGGVGRLTPEEVVRASADAAEQAVQAPLFTELMDNTMAVFGTALERRIAEDERPGLLVPCDVLRKGKQQLGAILMLDTRVLITWMLRRVKARRHVVDIALTDITRAEIVEAPNETVLLQTSQETWSLALNHIPGRKSLASTMLGALRATPSNV